MFYNISRWIPMFIFVFMPTVVFSADRGEQIINERCVLCHVAPDPEKLTKEEWVIKLKEMAPNAGLSSSETAEVMDYVSKLARSAASVLSMKTEKKLFDEKCSLCHTTSRALIMPMTPESVAEIVPRMQAMAGDWITDDQAHEISEYLVHGAPDSKRPRRSELAATDYDLFLQRCTACHTAEQIFSRLKSDKNATTVSSWKDIVSKMQQKAPNWIVRSEAEKIVKFLNGL